MNEIIKQISNRSRNQILNTLKDFDINYSDLADPSEHIKQSDNPLEELKQKMSENKFTISEVANANCIYDEINKIISTNNLNSCLYSKSLSIDIEKINANKKTCFDKKIENLRAEVFSSDFSIIDVDFAISSHGIACINSSENKPRMLSLAPMFCIMLLDKNKIEKSLSTSLGKIEKGILPSNILFIAGPSRTSDIELITVFGVHGSQKVHIIIF